MGVLGQVTELSAFEGGRFSWQAESGYVYKDPYGGVLFDTGSHTLDTLLYVACFDTGSLEVTTVHTQRDSRRVLHGKSAASRLRLSRNPP